MLYARSPRPWRHLGRLPLALFLAALLLALPGAAQALDILPVEAIVVSESGLQNGKVDPGETLTVSFTVFNNSFVDTQQLQATLRTTAQIVSGGATQSFGIIEGGDTGTLSFTFTASSVAYQPVRIFFDLNDNGVTGVVSFDLPGGQFPPLPARVGFSVTGESFSPPNGLPDVGETVTVMLTLRNNGPTATTNLTGALLANAVVSAPGAAQNFGAIPPGGTVARPFTFTVAGTANTTYNLVLQLTDTGLDYGTATFNGFRVARAAQVVVENMTLTSESAAPPNGSPDPGEIVTAALTLRNVGETHANAVSAQLVAGGGVPPRPPPRRSPSASWSAAARSRGASTSPAGRPAERRSMRLSRCSTAARHCPASSIPGWPARRPRPSPTPAPSPFPPPALPDPARLILRSSMWPA